MTIYRRGDIVAATKDTTFAGCCVRAFTVLEVVRHDSSDHTVRVNVVSAPADAAQYGFAVLGDADLWVKDDDLAFIKGRPLETAADLLDRFHGIVAAHLDPTSREYIGTVLDNIDAELNR